MELKMVGEVIKNQRNGKNGKMEKMEKNGKKWKKMEKMEKNGKKWKKMHQKWVAGCLCGQNMKNYEWNSCKKL